MLHVCSICVLNTYQSLYLLRFSQGPSVALKEMSPGAKHTQIILHVPLLLHSVNSLFQNSLGLNGRESTKAISNLITRTQLPKICPFIFHIWALRLINI